MRKIVISGSTGMIGSSLVRCALAQNFSVVCIVRKNSTKLNNILQSDKVQILQLDLSDYKNYEPKIKDCDTFIHLAWEKTFGASRDDVDVQVDNIQYTLDAVRLAYRMGCCAFVGVGSQAEYGPVDCDLTPETPVHPESGYGIAKYTAGRLSALLCSQLGIKQNWVRVLSVYGINDAPHTLISYVISELKEGRSPQLTKCEQIWDYLYCDDAAQGLLAIADKGISGKVYPLGFGKGQKLSEYIESIRNEINPKIPLGFGKKEYYPHQPMRLVANITDLVRDTGWKPNISFEVGLEKLLLF